MPFCAEFDPIKLCLCPTRVITQFLAFDDASLTCKLEFTDNLLNIDFVHIRAAYTTRSRYPSSDSRKGAI